VSDWCPPGYVHIDPMQAGVRCMDCHHEIPVTTSISRCRVGQIPAGAAGNWRSDHRHCETHQPKDVA